MPLFRSRESIRREITELWPSLSFHFGFSFFDLAKMPRWAIRTYADKLDGLLAQIEAGQLQASAYPHLKKSGQRKIQASLRKRMRPARESRRVRTPVSEVEFKQSVASSGIGIRFKPKKE